jgi:predicted dehydrogenase
MIARAVRVGVIGCGRQGTFHLEAYQALPHVNIIAVCDIDARRAAEAADRFGATPYERFDELLASDELDLVSVVTMPVTHREIVVAALAAGIHVLCEKPMAMNLGEAREMAAAAAATSATLTLGYNMRRMGSAQYLRSLVESGEIGRPMYTRTWCLDSEVPAWGKHYVAALAGGGVFMADAGHVLDLALFVGGYSRPTTVSASSTRVFPRKRAGMIPPDEAAAYDVEDLASAHIRFDDGTWMTLEVAWGWDAPKPSYSFELIAERAGIRFDPLRVVREVDGRPTDVTPRGIAETDWDTSVRAEVAAVVESIRDRSAPIVALEEALTVQAIIDACYRSTATGREVEVARIG